MRKFGNVRLAEAQDRINCKCENLCLLFFKLNCVSLDWIDSGFRITPA